MENRGQCWIGSRPEMRPKSEDCLLPIRGPLQVVAHKVLLRACPHRSAMSASDMTLGGGRVC